MEPLIPKVKEEVCYSIEQAMIDDGYLRNTAKHLAEHNPTVAGFIHSFTGRLPLCCKKAAMLAAFTTYRMIESQMEANKMNIDIKL